MKCIKTMIKKLHIRLNVGCIMTVAVLLLCAGFIAEPSVSKAGTFGVFEFSMDSDTNEITITGLNDSGKGLQNLVIPAQVNGYSVTKISRNAFSGNNDIVSVTFESAVGVKELGSSAFAECTSLTSIALPTSVRTIGCSCFEGCKALQSIVIPEGVTEIEYETFRNCEALSGVALPSTLKTLGGSWSFMGGVFEGCSSLKTINLPGAISAINRYTFAYSGLESITIPDSVTEIGNNAFSSCEKLVSVTLSNNLKELSSRIFSGCVSLKNLSFPIDMEEVGSYAFSGCSELETVTFGDAIKSIGNSAFSDCPKLVVRTVRGTQAEVYCMNNNINYVTYASSIRGCVFEGIVEKIYNGAPQTQSMVVKLGVVPLTENVDYTVSYTNNVNVGTATITVTGIGNYIGYIHKEFRIAPISIEKAKVSVKSRLKYNAKYQTPKVGVKLNGKALPASSYSVSYYGNCFVGTATVTVRGTGNYSGTVTKTFNIVPKGTKIKAVKGVSKGFTVSYKENNIQTTGYQVQYSTDKKFKKNSKISTVKNVKKKSKTVTKLKGGKKYYVRVRTYALIGNKKICSSWTPAKTVKTKR